MSVLLAIIMWWWHCIWKVEVCSNRCRVSITLSSRNLEYLAESFASLVERGVGVVAVSPVASHDPGWHADAIDELTAQVAEILDVSIEHYRRTGEVPFSPFKAGEPRDPPLPSSCRSTHPPGRLPQKHSPLARQFNSRKRHRSNR